MEREDGEPKPSHGEDDSRGPDIALPAVFFRPPAICLHARFLKVNGASSDAFPGIYLLLGLGVGDFPFCIGRASESLRACVVVRWRGG